MQIIDELEPDPRGAYCGAIGYIGLEGTMILNLAIRTMCLMGDQIELAVGSGIVADSDPEEEFEELSAKAAGMMAALGSDKCVPAESSAKKAAGGGCSPFREPVLR
jgi:para-aminobenzoate synthetase component 1